MTISDRILRRVMARIERQAPVPQVDGLHGQHAVTLPAADWPYLIDAVTKLDDWRCAKMQAETNYQIDLVVALRDLWIGTSVGTDAQRLEAQTAAGDLLARIGALDVEAASPARGPSHRLDDPK